MFTLLLVVPAIRKFKKSLMNSGAVDGTFTRSAGGHEFLVGLGKELIGPTVNQ
jgi:hypothetical protein